MTDEFALALPESNLPEKFDDSVIDAMTSGSAFLPRMQLMTSSSKACKEDGFTINSFARVQGDKTTELGKQVDGLILARRPKAVDFQSDPVICVYDPKLDAEGNMTGIFKDLVDRSGGQDSGIMWGTEFLVWIPQTREFMTLFMGTKSGRIEASSMLAVYKSWKKGEKKVPAATFEAKRIKNKSYTWYVPTCRPCSTPFDMPDVKEVISQIEAFENPKETAPELAEDTGETTTRDV